MVKVGIQHLPQFTLVGMLSGKTTYNSFSNDGMGVMNQKLKTHVNPLWCHCPGAAPQHSVEHCALLGGFELKRGGPLTASCLLKRGRDQGNVGPLDPWGNAGIIMHLGPLMRPQLQ